MALKEITTEQLIEALGYTVEDAEKVTLDDIKTHVDTKFVLRDNVLKDDEIKKKITGKVLGSIGTKAAQIFGLKSSEIDGKPLEEIMNLANVRYASKIEELEANAGKGNDKKVEELTKQLGELSQKAKIAEDGLKQWEEKYNAENSQWAGKLKEYKLNDKVSKVKQSLQDKFTEDYSKNELVKAGFESHINSTYLFDLDENDNPVVKLKADGSIVKSKKTVGHAATLDEIFLSEMEAKNVLKKNNAKPEKVITFAPVNPDNGGVKIGSKAAQRIAEIQSGQA